MSIANPLDSQLDHKMPMLENSTERKPKRARKSGNEREGNKDRLSELPDSLVIHILSFMNCRDAVRTCTLSRRWKDLWKQLPTLTLRSADFETGEIFSEFVPRVLSLRDGSLALDALDFQGAPGDPGLLERVVSYATSRNVRHLGIRASPDDGHLPHSIFSCQTLTSLKLSVGFSRWRTPPSFPESLNLPALTTLHLENFAFCASDNDRAEPFSGCNRLNDLVIKDCILRGAKALCVSSTTLSSLAIHTVRFPYRCPYFYEIVLSTPNLRSFAFEGDPLPNLSGSNLYSVEQVRIDSNILSRHSKSPSILLDWLKGLINVQSLTVSANNLQVLFMIPGLLEVKLPSLGNLKSLKVKLTPVSRKFTISQGPAKSLSAKLKLKRRAVPDEIVNFLLQNSPSAEVVFIKRRRKNVHSTL